MWQNFATVIVLAFMVGIPLSNGLYFHIAETERKCFIEEIPDETMVTGKNYNTIFVDTGHLSKKLEKPTIINKHTNDFSRRCCRGC